MNTVQPIRDPGKIEEVKALLLQSSYRDFLLFVMGINTGLRISDLLQLKVADIRDKEHLVIQEGKTQKPKRIRIAETLKRELPRYLAGKSDETYVFASQKNPKAPISRIQAYRVLRSAAAKAGLEDIGTHTMRKTFGYHFYKQTKDVALLQELFNHAAPSITLRYIGINQDVMDNAMDDFSI